MRKLHMDMPMHMRKLHMPMRKLHMCIPMHKLHMPPSVWRQAHTERICIASKSAIIRPVECCMRIGSEAVVL